MRLMLALILGIVPHAILCAAETVSPRIDPEAVIRPGQDIDFLIARLTEAGYKETDGLELAPEKDSGIKFFAVGDGTLIVSYTFADKKAQKITYYFCDERDKASRKEFYFLVTEIDPKKGIMIIKLPEKHGINAPATSTSAGPDVVDDIEKSVGIAKHGAAQALGYLKNQTLDNVKNVVRPLSEQNIEQYIQAYRNFAKIAPQLEEERKKSGAGLIFTSTECRTLLAKAVQDAGYPDFISFILMDLRICYTMRGVAYARIAKCLGEIAEELSADAAREGMKQKNEMGESKKIA